MVNVTWSYYPDGWTMLNRNAKISDVNLFHKGLIPAYWTAGFAGGSIPDWFAMILRLDSNWWNLYYNNTTCTPGSACRTNLGSFFYEFPKETNNVPIEFIPITWSEGSFFTVGKVMIYGPEQNTERRYWGFFGLVPDTTIYSINSTTGFNIAIPENTDSFCNNSYDLLNGIARNFVTGETFPYDVPNGILFGISTGPCVFNGQENFVLIVKSNGILYGGYYPTNISPASVQHSLSVRSSQGNTILSLDGADIITVSAVPIGNLKPLWGIASFSDTIYYGASPTVYFKNITLGSCTPNWQCRQPLDGYEHDINNCGQPDRLNAICNAPCVPNWQCRQPPDGYEHDINNCGQADRPNSACIISCTSITIIPDKTIAYIGNAIDLTVNVQPITQIYNIDIRDSYDNLIGNCTTSNGICTINWPTVGLVAGQYSLVASASTQCISSPILITLLENCISLTISPDKTSAPVGETIALTIGSEPTTQPYTIEIRDSYNTLIGNCTTSNGTCTTNWATIGLLSGQYIITAKIIDVPIGGCTSSPISITLLKVCPTLTITSNKTSTYVGNVILLTINSEPSIQPYIIEVRDQFDNLIGSCTTSGGTCTISWATTNIPAGQYDLTARATDIFLETCTSSSTSITLQPTISLMNSSWPKFHGDLRNSGFSNVRSTTNGIIKWEFPIISSEICSPAIDNNGTIYLTPIANNVYNPVTDSYELYSRLLAINPDGTLKWTYDLVPDTWFMPPDNPTTGFHFAPAIDNTGIIYITGSSDGIGSLVAINPDGTLKWFKMVGGSSIYASPSIGNDGTIYVCRQTRGSNRGLTAVDQEGNVKWHYITDSNVYTSPVISDDGKVWISNSDGLFTIDQTGNLLSYISLNADANSPIIGRDGTVYIVDSYNSNLLAIDPTTYSVKWTSPTLGNIDNLESAYQSSPVIDDDNNTIYAISSSDIGQYPITNTVHSISTIDGSINWSYDVGSTDIQTNILLVDKNGTIYTYGTINNAFAFIAIDKDGNLKWYNNIDTFRSTPAMDASGIIYVGTRYGSLVAFDLCVPDWQCRQPLDGYEHDINNCGEPDRPNIVCNAPSPPNIVATTIVPSYTNCIEPCDITVDITWINTGETVGIFIPTIVVDGTSTPLQTDETLGPAQSIVKTFPVTGLTAGTHVICAIPDSFATCATVTVEKVVEAGLSLPATILASGILFGMLFSKTCDKCKTRKECEDAGCKWVDGRCVKPDKSSKS